jgi:hypothetical protein
MTTTTTDMSTSIRAGRYRVPRTRGAMSGLLLLALGAWAALVPFIGPYLDLAYTPAPNDAWHWTSARGWLEVLPGAAAFLGGLLLLLSANRLVALFGGWLAAAGGGWLIVGPPLADLLNINLGTPDPTSSTGVRALEALLFFYGIGAAILLVAALAIGRLSVLSLRDVQAAERRIAAERAEADEAGWPAAYRNEPDEATTGRHGAPNETTAPHGDAVVHGDGQEPAGYGPQTAYGAPNEQNAPNAPNSGYPPNYPPTQGEPTQGEPTQGEPTYAHTAPPPPPEEQKS